MNKFCRSSRNIEDIYVYLALNILNQAFEDIQSYYAHHGTKEQIAEGKRSLKWIRHMEGNFKVIVNVLSNHYNLQPDRIHQMCLKAINERRKKHGQQSVAR
jgi:hypothetical protein